MLENPFLIHETGDFFFFLVAVHDAWGVEPTLGREATESGSREPHTPHDRARHETLGGERTWRLAQGRHTRTAPTVQSRGNWGSQRPLLLPLPPRRSRLLRTKRLDHLCNGLRVDARLR